MPAKTMDEIVSLCKRRGFVFQGSEVYGGLKGTYDFGPLGVELKKNIRQAWWRAMVYERDDIEGLECAHISHPLVWKYSGHEAGFFDLLQVRQTFLIFALSPADHNTLLTNTIAL